MKFRKKPVIIEGVQWFKHGDHPSVRKTSYKEIAELLNTSGCSKKHPWWSWEALGIIETLEGPHIVIPGDWILTGVEGEHYPIKEQILRETYEEVV